MAVRQSSETLRRPQTLLWITFPIIALTSLVLGYIGFSGYRPTPVDFGTRPIDLLYYDLQLFVLGADPFQSHPGPYPFTLEVARFAAPAVTIYAVVETIRLLLAVELSRLRARRARGHAVVCGDSAIADTLTRRLQAQGTTVIEIRSEADEFVSPGEALRIIGDPRDPEVLRAAGIAQAATVYACAQSSAANVAIALTITRAVGSPVAGRVRRRTRDGGLVVVHSLVSDSDFCATVQAFFLGWDAPGRVRLDFFNIDDIAARRLFADAPTHLVGERAPRIVVAGTDALARALVVEAARCWRLSGDGEGQRLPITMAGPDAIAIVRALTSRYLFLDSVCQLSAVDDELLAVMRSGRLRQPPDRILITDPDEERALQTAMIAERYWLGQSGPITVRLDGALIRDATSSGRPDMVVGTLHMFGAVAVASDPDLIEDDLTERLARVIHDRYLLGRINRGDGALNGMNQTNEQAMVSWAALPSRLRQANRAQAEDIGRKLAHIGCVVVPRRAGQEETVLTDDDVERLVLMEHQRWCADLQKAGWEYAPQFDEQRQLHPGLLSWDQLPPQLQLRNYDSVRELPTILGDAGFQIMRATSDSQPVIA